MADGEARKRAEILIGIDQRMVNQKEPSLKTKEAIPSKMIEKSKDAFNVIKRVTLKGTVWQKMSTYIMRRKQMKILI